MNNKLQLTSHERRATGDEFSAGSALILAVVLTSLLAIIGVVFLLSARIDKMAASAFSENRELDFAVETVVTKISRELVLDVPGIAGQEYYDYPGTEDRWLASLEPNDNRVWPQISDITITGLLAGFSGNVQIKVIGEYDAIADPNTPFTTADADGDGVGDSKWVILTDVTSTKGRPIYAAIRIIDNGAMLNANTAYKFNPNETDPNLIDGSSQLQINLMALANRPGRPITPPGKDEVALLAERADYRFGNNIADLPKYEIDLAAYEPNVIWRYGSPAGAYTPFDISDELELRYRFLLNHTGIDTRLEGWGGEFRKATSSTPFESKTEWFISAYDTGGLDPNYAYRHIATTCNMDRVINPTAGQPPAQRLNNGKMVNVNDASYRNQAEKNAYIDLLYRAIYSGLSDANFAGNRVEVAAQVAVNLIDYRDSDDDVTSFAAPDGKIYYGFERPCIYISELDYNQVTIMTGSPPTQTIYKSYAVELYKPYSEDSVPGSGFWRIAVNGAPINIDSWPAGKSFCIIRNQDPAATITVDPNAVVQNSGAVIFTGNSKVELQRMVRDPNGASKYIAVDSIWVPSWLVLGDGLRSFQRDMTKHKCIRRLWGSSTKAPTLGSINSYVDSSTGLIQAHPANKLFTNIGEIGMIFVKSAYSQGPNPIVSGDTEVAARLNLANPAFQQIFNYLTVIDPISHGLPSSETRIKGRININTAPWLVIAQLPWMQPPIAQAIVAYRDGAAKGFRSIGELMNVAEMDYYQNLQPGNLTGFPDLTPNDGAADDFEERDVIFARISNLVTVRSDVFTAYILVRIGADGPQRRVMAILDRSQVRSSADRVKIIALYPVPDPR